MVEKSDHDLLTSLNTKMNGICTNVKKLDDRMYKLDEKFDNKIDNLDNKIDKNTKDISDKMTCRIEDCTKRFTPWKVFATSVSIIAILFGGIYTMASINTKKIIKIETEQVILHKETFSKEIIEELKKDENVSIDVEDFNEKNFSLENKK